MSEIHFQLQGKRRCLSSTDVAKIYPLPAAPVSGGNVLWVRMHRGGTANSLCAKFLEVLRLALERKLGRLTGFVPAWKTWLRSGRVGYSRV